MWPVSARESVTSSPVEVKYVPFVVMSGLRERRKQRTYRVISDAAIALFLEKGFDEVSVAEVAAAAEISKPTLFRYFPAKEDLAAPFRRPRGRGGPGGHRRAGGRTRAPGELAVREVREVTTATVEAVRAACWPRWTRRA
ncbi:hypothetical protein GCM10009730_49500 [Streptomyces albidochromogenes]